MVTCAVENCKNSTAKISKVRNGISFHSFPRDKNRRSQWEVAVNRSEDWSSTSNSKVCSEHFESNQFYVTESGLRKLKGDAVPTINLCILEECQPTIATITPGIEPGDSKEVIQLKHKVRRLEIIAASRKKQLKLMWQSKKRLRDKLRKMKCLITHLVVVKTIEGDL